MKHFDEIVAKVSNRCNVLTSMFVYGCIMYKCTKFFVSAYASISVLHLSDLNNVLGT